MNAGQCYEVAFRTLAQLVNFSSVPEIESSSRLVHGDVKLTGDEPGHAWVEVGNAVIDMTAADGNPIFLKEEYYHVYNVEIRAAYTYAEAMINYTRASSIISSLPQGGPGPWDQKARTRLGLLPLP